MVGLKGIVIIILFILVGSAINPVFSIQEYGRCGDADNASSSSPDTSQLNCIPTNPLFQGGWFTPNLGQFPDSHILFRCRSDSQTFDFFENGYSITNANPPRQMITVSFPGSSPCLPTGQDPLPHVSNYFIGSEPADWYRNVLSFGSIRYSDLFSGIDLVFTSNEQCLKYDLIVSPGADPKSISLHYLETDSLTLEANGDLYIRSGGFELVEAAPVTYQITDGKKEMVSSAFRVEGLHVSFDLGEYDPSLPLIIDPLIYSTYVGGRGMDSGQDIVVDQEGNAYIAGTTNSDDFPDTFTSKNGITEDGQFDLVVFKMRSHGGSLRYSTYIGGNGSDRARKISIDHLGNVYVIGETTSNDFPTTEGCHDSSYNGNWDAFVLCLNNYGNELVYSTYLGGEGKDLSGGIAIDPEKPSDIFVTGTTGSDDFPTTQQALSRERNGSDDLFVTWLNLTSGGLQFSTFLGGENAEGYDCDIELSKDWIYVAGDTRSEGFPTTQGAYGETLHGSRDAFVSMFRREDLSLAYSTYIGGSQDDCSVTLEVDALGGVLIAGRSNSKDLPLTTDLIRGSPTDLDDLDFGISVTKLNANLSSIEFMTRFGGSGSNQPAGMVLDPLGNIVIGGSTNSTDFPVTYACYESEPSGSTDCFIATLPANGTKLTYATYLGGESLDELYGVSVDTFGDVYVTGATNSDSFPTSQWTTQRSRNGYYDAFVTKLTPQPFAAIILSSPDIAYEGQEIELRGTCGENVPVSQYKWDSSIDGDLPYYSGSYPFSRVYVHLSEGMHVIELSAMDRSGHWSLPAKTVIEVRYRPSAKINSIRIEPEGNDYYLVFNTSASVENDTLDRYVWTSSIYGEFHNDSVPLVEYGELSPGDHLLTFKVQDNHRIWSSEVSARALLNDTSDSGHDGSDQESDPILWLVAVMLGGVGIILMVITKMDQIKRRYRSKTMKQFGRPRKPFNQIRSRTKKSTGKKTDRPLKIRDLRHSKSESVAPQANGLQKQDVAPMVEGLQDRVSYHPGNHGAIPEDGPTQPPPKHSEAVVTPNILSRKVGERNISNGRTEYDGRPIAEKQRSAQSGGNEFAPGSSTNSDSESD